MRIASSSRSTVNKQYGLMRSYLAWTVEEARLWEVRPQHVLLGDWKTDPIHLADYSRSADVETELVDVGNGTSEADYSGKNKDVRGKIVLADGVLARVQELAIAQHGAAGIVSDMPNQTTAWSGLDRTVVRWGHLDARQPSGFAFMVSRQTAGGTARSFASRRKRRSECSRKSGRRPRPLDGRDGHNSRHRSRCAEKSSIAAISITNVPEQTITEAAASRFLNPRACWRV